MVIVGSHSSLIYVIDAGIHSPCFDFSFEAAALFLFVKLFCTEFALCKYAANMNFTKLCTRCKCGDGRICWFLCEFAYAIFALVAKLCKLQQICTRQIWGKFDFSSCA